MENSPPPGSRNLICERKSLAAIFCSGSGVLILLMTPLTLGIAMIVLLVAYSGLPKRLWREGDRIHADKLLPADGLAINQIHSATLYVRRLFFVPVLRYLIVKYVHNGQTGQFGLNRLYYGRDGFDAAVRQFVQAAQNAAPAPAQQATSRGGGVWRFLGYSLAILLFLSGVAFAGVLQFISIAEQQTTLESAVKRIELKQNGEQTYKGKPIAAMDMLETWRDSAQKRLSDARLIQMISLGGSGAGLMLLIGLRISGRNRDGQNA